METGRKVTPLFSISPTLLKGVLIVRNDPFTDNRGYFERVFCDDELKSAISPRSIVQVNHSRTNRVGAVRGLHYQNPPHAEMKLVRCIRGRVFDVALDLRKDSPTFLTWHAEELSAENRVTLIIPEGVAHGFQVMAPESELLYFHTAAYAPAAEGAVRFDDPRAAITWPLPPTDISARDIQHPLLDMHFQGISV